MSSLAWKSLAPRRARRRRRSGRSASSARRSARFRASWLEQYAGFMIVLGAVLVPVGGVLDRPLLHAAGADRRDVHRAAVRRRRVRFAACRIPGVARVGGRARRVLRVGIDRRHAAGAWRCRSSSTAPACLIHSRSHETARPRSSRRRCWPRGRCRTRSCGRASSMLGTGTPNADPDRFGPSVGDRRRRCELSRGFRRRRRAARRGSGAFGDQGAECRQPEDGVRHPPAFGSHAGAVPI